jgi:hypothetical protein
MNEKLTVEDVTKLFGEWQEAQPLGVKVFSEEEMLLSFQAGFNAALEYVNSTIEDKK